MKAQGVPGVRDENTTQKVRLGTFAKNPEEFLGIQDDHTRLLAPTRGLSSGSEV